MPTKNFLGLCVASVILVACGSSTTESGTPPTQAGLETALRLSSEATIASKTEEAYAYFSADCKSQVSLDDFASGLLIGKESLEAFFGINFEDLELGKIEVSNFTDTSATVREELLLGDGEVVSGLDESEPSEWVYENGGWRTTDCSDFKPVDDAKHARALLVPA